MDKYIFNKIIIEPSLFYKTIHDYGYTFNMGCEYWGCTDSDATNYADEVQDDPETPFVNEYSVAATNCEDGSIGEYSTCCTYADVLLSFGEITSSTIEIIMQNSEAVSGFQFNLTGGSILESTSGGSATDNGFSISINGTLLIGFTFTGDPIPESGSCSDDQYTNPNDCEYNTETWIRTGSCTDVQYTNLNECEDNDETWTIPTNILTIISTTSISEPICIENIIISDISAEHLEVNSTPVCSQ